MHLSGPCDAKNERGRVDKLTDALIGIAAARTA